MSLVNKHKKLLIIVLPLILVIGSFVFGNYAHAQTGWATDIMTGILSRFIWALGLILALVIHGLIYIASYQEFITSPAVSYGWAMVRDVSNMFFVVILMIIAFGTILHLENYNYKKWLPKLILMAILINFSKTICGLLIDLAQVVMLTFVNAFKDVGSANIADMLGITKIVTMADNGGDSSFSTIVGAYILGLIYLLVAIVVMVTMMAMLAMRLVMIWIYVVLSPLAYLLAAFPGGQKYASQWWSEFIKNLIVGPVLAFFIWLSLVSLSGVNNMADNAAKNTDVNTKGAVDTAVIKQAGGSLGNTASVNNDIGTEASTPSALIGFVVGIGMLLGGLKISQEIGGAAGGLAGKGMAKINQGATFAGNKARSYATSTAKVAGRMARHGSLMLASKMSKGLGKSLNKNSGPGGSKVGNALQDMGKVGSSWVSDMRATNKKARTDKRQKFLEKIGMGEKTMEAHSEFLKTDAGKDLSNAVRGAGVGAVVGGGAGPIGAFIGALTGFLAGGAGGYLSASLGKKAEKENFRSQTLKAEAASETDPIKKKSLEEKAEKADGNSKRYEKASNFVGSAQAWSSNTTQRAAANGSKEIKNAKQNVKNASDDVKDFMRDSSSGTFYSTSGGAAKKNIEQLADSDNPNGEKARANIADYIRSSSGGANKAEKNAIAGLAKGIAAAKKGGMDVSGFSDIISAINSNNGNVGDEEGLAGKTVDSLNDKVIAYRNTGQTGEQGSGELAVNTLANNDENVEAKNIIGTDFNKLKEQGVDIDSDAEGANVSGAAMVNIASAVIQQINTEQSNLETAKNNGEIDEKEYTSRNSDLNKAKEKLSNPDEMKNLSMVNTASKNYGRQEKMASVYHEEIHKGGVEDEELAEGMSKSLMSNKLYGRNGETGGRHATEIAGMAKGMKESGMSNDDILKEVDKEIKSRVSTEGKNRAARVISKESGKKESESDAVEKEEPKTKEDKKTTPEINTEELQKTIDELAVKFKSFEITSPSLAKPSGVTDATSSYALRSLLKKVASSNERLAKKISTPLEVEVLLKTNKAENA